MAGRTMTSPAFAKALLGALLGLVLARPALAQTFDDAEAQLRVRQAAAVQVLAAREVEEIGRALEAERGRAVASNEERELNRATIAGLEAKLAAAKTQLQLRERELAEAKQARARGLASEAGRRAREEQETARQRDEAETRAREAREKAAKEAVAREAAREAASKAAAARQPPWAVIQRSGLAGTWATSCRARAAEYPWRLIFHLGPDGAPRVTADFGSIGTPAVNLIERAEAIAPTRVRVRLRQLDTDKPVVRDDTYELSGGHLQEVASVLTSGWVRIRDGVWTMDGKPTNVLEKCSN